MSTTAKLSIKFSATHNLLHNILRQLKKYEVAIAEEAQDPSLVDEVEAINQSLLDASIAIGKHQEAS